MIMKNAILILAIFFLTSFNVHVERWDEIKRDWSPLMLAIYKNKNSKVERLIKRKEGIAFVSSGKHSDWRLTPLEVAIRCHNTHAVELLLASKEYNELNDFLMVACAEDNVKIVEALIQFGADPNFTTEGNHTIVMAASSFGSPEVLKTLLKVTSQTINQRRLVDGITALMLAARQKDLDKVKILLEFGADKSSNDNKGRFAYNYVDMPYGEENQNYDYEKQQLKILLKTK